MNTTKIRAAIAIGFTAAFISAGAGGMGAVSAASATSAPVMYGSDGGGPPGWSHGKVRPGAIYFGAGGDLFVRPLKWAKWGSYARARGTRRQNSCVPTCSRGTFINSQASVTLWRVRTHKGHLYYSRMTLSWTHNGSHKVSYSYSTPPGATSPFWH